MEKFIVSARKYRPATFASVVGQNHITSTFVETVAFWSKNNMQESPEEIHRYFMTAIGK